jgi:hypothetical protein
MPRRNPILDPSIRYKAYLCEFMAFFRQRAQAYPTDHNFERDELLAIRPKDLEKWMCKKVYGVEEPGPNDHPTMGRANSLMFYKKALSYFMPNKRLGWNEVTETGNPTRSADVNDRIKRVRKEEVRKTGKKSSARRRLHHNEWVQTLRILERSDDRKKRFLTPCVMKVQYNMIGRLDDAMELEMEDIHPNLQFPFTLLIQMCWSKNVHDERDVGEQILLGSMNRDYCVLLALALFLEIWIESGEGMLGTLVFNVSDDDPKKSKESVANILFNDTWKDPDFRKIQEGPIGTHSMRKLPYTHARRCGCSRDDSDHRGRWKRKKRQSGPYEDPVLPYPDAMVAGKLCIGGPCKYVLKENCGVSDDWLAEYVVPNILRRFPREIGMVLARSLLWACFDDEVKQLLPPSLTTRILTAYQRIRQLPEDENPVKKVLLVITGNEDELQIDELSGDDVAAARQLGNDREELLALRSQNTMLRRTVDELQTDLVQFAHRTDQNFIRMNRNINRIAIQPARRVGAGRNQNAENAAEGEQYVSNLSPTPRTLHVLWQEYEFGIGGRKPARLFTPAERGKVKFKYSRRKVVWDVIAARVRAGETAQVAIDRIYEVYGAGKTVSYIITMMQRDRRVYNGCHPQLQV